jgi:hypothetical protein
VPACGQPFAMTRARTRYVPSLLVRLTSP